MNLAVALFKSSIGRKILMAATGLLLIGFITGHLIGNLHIFGDPDEINGYSHFLQSLGPVLWMVRIGLLVVVALHIWAGVVLALENRKARPRDYEFRHTIQATLASRTMRMTALVVFVFILYHLAHFTIGLGGSLFQGDSYKTALPPYVMERDFHLAGLPLVKGGTVVHDVFNMVAIGFQSPVVSGFYIVAVGLLTLHLWHGAESMFQTLGLRTGRWAGFLRFATRAYCLLYFFGNLTIPASILLGLIEPHGAVSVAGSTSVHP